MTVETTTLYPLPCWRSSDREPLVPMVEIPRDLALDLVRYLSFSSFVAETSDEDCQAGLHEKHSQEHETYMETMEDMVSSELSDQGVAPTSEAILRALGIAYEASGLMRKQDIARVAAVQPLNPIKVESAAATA